MNCTTYEFRLEAFLDGNLSVEKASDFEKHLAECPECTSEVALSHRIRTELRNGRVDCPDEVFDAALARIATLNRDRPAIPARKQARWYLAATAAALVVLAATVLQLSTPEPSATYTAEEVAEARQQVELAFGLVGEATRDAGVYLRKDIFVPHVFEPMRRGFGAAE